MAVVQWDNESENGRLDLSRKKLTLDEWTDMVRFYLSLTEQERDRCHDTPFAPVEMG